MELILSPGDATPLKWDVACDNVTARILVVVQTALTLVFTYSDSSPGDAIPLKWDVACDNVTARILVVVQTALTLVFTYSDSSPGDAIPLKWDVVTNVGDGDFFTWG